MASTPTFVSAINTVPVQILPADTTTQKSLIAGGTNGTKVTSLQASSTETALAHVVEVSILRGGTNSLLAAVNVPVNSGFDGTTPAVDLLNSTIMPGLPVDNDGQHYLFLKSGDTLQVKAQVTVNTGKALNFYNLGADV